MNTNKALGVNFPLRFSTSFDTVDSEIITKKYTMPLSWFENYLTDMKQTVQFKSEESDERPVNCGTWHKEVSWDSYCLYFMSMTCLKCAQRSNFKKGI